MGRHRPWPCVSDRSSGRGNNGDIFERLAVDEERLEWERTKEELLLVKRQLAERDEELVHLKTNLRKLEETLRKKDKDLQNVFAVLRAPQDAELTKKRKAELIERLLMETQQRVVNAEAVAEDRKRELDRLRFSSKFLKFQELEIEIQEYQTEIQRLRRELSQVQIVGKLRISQAPPQAPAETNSNPTPRNSSEFESRTSQVVVPVLVTSPKLHSSRSTQQVPSKRESFVEKTRRRAIEAEYAKQMRLAQLEAECELEENLVIRARREARAQAETRRREKKAKTTTSPQDIIASEPAALGSDTGASPTTTDATASTTEVTTESSLAQQQADAPTSDAIDSVGVQASERPTGPCTVPESSAPAAVLGVEQVKEHVAEEYDDFVDDEPQQPSVPKKNSDIVDAHVANESVEIDESVDDEVDHEVPMRAATTTQGFTIPVSSAPEEIEEEPEDASEVAPAMSHPQALPAQLRQGFLLDPSGKGSDDYEIEEKEEMEDAESQPLTAAPTKINPDPILQPELRQGFLLDPTTSEAAYPAPNPDPPVVEHRQGFLFDPSSRPEPETSSGAAYPEPNSILMPIEHPQGFLLDPSSPLERSDPEIDSRPIDDLSPLTSARPPAEQPQQGFLVDPLLGPEHSVDVLPDHNVGHSVRGATAVGGDHDVTHTQMKTADPLAATSALSPIEASQGFVVDPIGTATLGSEVTERQSPSVEAMQSNAAAEDTEDGTRAAGTRDATGDGVDTSTETVSRDEGAVTEAIQVDGVIPIHQGFVEVEPPVDRPAAEDTAHGPSAPPLADGTREHPQGRFLLDLDAQNDSEPELVRSPMVEGPSTLPEVHDQQGFVMDPLLQIKPTVEIAPELAHGVGIADHKRPAEVESASPHEDPGVEANAGLGLISDPSDLRAAMDAAARRIQRFWHKLERRFARGPTSEVTTATSAADADAPQEAPLSRTPSSLASPDEPSSPMLSTSNDDDDDE